MIGTAVMAAQATAPAMLETLPPGQKAVALILSAVILGVVLELVRRRKLREEYALLWLGTALVLLALALQPRLLNLFMTAIGAKTAPSALFFGALVFLMLVSLLVSIRLSRLTFRNKALSQQAALQRRELEELAQEIDGLRREVTRIQDGDEPDRDAPLARPRRIRPVADDGTA